MGVWSSCRRRGVGAGVATMGVQCCYRPWVVLLPRGWTVMLWPAQGRSYHRNNHVSLYKSHLIFFSLIWGVSHTINDENISKKPIFTYCHLAPGTITQLRPCTGPRWRWAAARGPMKTVSVEPSRRTRMLWRVWRFFFCGRGGGEGIIPCRWASTLVGHILTLEVGDRGFQSLNACHQRSPI
jgi:hypothetical protein